MPALPYSSTNFAVDCPNLHIDSKTTQIIFDSTRKIAESFFSNLKFDENFATSFKHQLLKTFDSLNIIKRNEFFILEELLDVSDEKLLSQFAIRMLTADIYIQLFDHTCHTEANLCVDDNFDKCLSSLNKEQMCRESLIRQLYSFEVDAQKLLSKNYNEFALDVTCGVIQQLKKMDLQELVIHDQL